MYKLCIPGCAAVCLATLVDCGGHMPPRGTVPSDAGDAAILSSADAGPKTQQFVNRQGQGLALGGAPFRMRGITFSSNYYGTTGSSITDPAQDHDHSAQDFARVAELGMNVVQLILSYRAFEDDANPLTYREEGWAWLDDNIQQAKNNGLRVVLDMLMVPGGDWHTIPPVSLDFWTNPALRDRYERLWMAIAKRYADEPAIAAYSLLNEPVTVNADGASWWSLADDTISGIRTVDSNHLVIVNPLAGVNGNYGLSGGAVEYKLVYDTNVLYDIHFYEPSDFVFQGASFMTNAPSVGAVYPDPAHPTVVGDLVYVEGDTNNATLPAGTSDWQSLQGNLYRVSSAEAAVSYPAVICNNMTAAGTAYFDDFVVNEYDQTGAPLAAIMTGSSAGNWTAYSEDASGQTGTCGGACRVMKGSGHASDSALVVSGNYPTALLSTWSYLFVVQPGHSYEITGWAKGVAIDVAARCQFTIGFYKPAAGGKVTYPSRGLCRVAPEDCSPRAPTNPYVPN